MSFKDLIEVTEDTKLSVSKIVGLDCILQIMGFVQQKTLIVNYFP